MVQCRPWHVPPREYAGIAQSVEQLIRNQQVACSSHVSSSTKKPRSNECGFFALCDKRKVQGSRCKNEGISLLFGATVVS